MVETNLKAAQGLQKPHHATFLSLLFLNGRIQEQAFGLRADEGFVSGAQMGMEARTVACLYFMISSCTQRWSMAPAPPVGRGV